MKDMARATVLVCSLGLMLAGPGWAIDGSTRPSAPPDATPAAVEQPVTGTRTPGRYAALLGAILGDPAAGLTSAGKPGDSPTLPAAVPPLVRGSGTPDFIPIWTDSMTIGNSGIFQSGGKVGIGTTTPASTLDVRATFTTAVRGTSTNDVGVFGQAIIADGVRGESSSVGVHGISSGFIGVQGESTSGTGVRGSSSNFIGVQGDSTNYFGVVGTSTSGGGVFGQSSSDVGVAGNSSSNSGVQGNSPSGRGVSGFSSSGEGVFGQSITGLGAVEGFSSGSARAGYFVGDVDVTGTLTASSKNFLIDHPLDPANRYLYHASVESSEMMNIYTGNVALDSAGEAVVELPGWFEALNQSFRYQLTAVGAPAPGLYIAEEIARHHFKIAGGSAGVKVSWQVTAVRRDAFAKAHPLQVEVEKPETERGYYVHPELYGAPRERAIEWARQPETMKWMKEMRERLVQLPEGSLPNPPTVQ
jgi:hypothetical protein